MTPRLKVLITGSSGLIGRLVINGLRDKYDFVGLSRRPTPDIPYVQGDINDGAGIKPAFQGMDMVLHLAAETQAVYDWDKTLSTTVMGTINVFQAAHEAGVKRVVFGSAGCVMCGYETEADLPYGKLAAGRYEEAGENWPMISYKDLPRPDGPYSVGKLTGEAAGRWYADVHGLSVLCLRLGALLDTDRPKLIRHFPGFLSHADCVQAIDKALSAPLSLKFDIFDVLSENKYRWRDTSHTKAVLGWQPTGTADIYDPDDLRNAVGQ